MEPGRIFISVWNCRATVSRYVGVLGQPGVITFEPAMNWESLQDDATDAVDDQGGAVTMSGHYVCPPALAERAHF